MLSKGGKYELMKKAINVSIDAYLVDAFKTLARLKGRSLSYLINKSLEDVFREVVKDYLEEDKDPEYKLAGSDIVDNFFSYTDNLFNKEDNK